MGIDVVTEFVHPEDLANVPDPESGAARRPMSYEARFRCADGSYRWLAVTAKEVVDPAGDVVGLAGSARDVTDAVSAREEQDAVSERILAIFNLLLDPLVILRALRDAEGRIVDYEFVDANEAIARHTHRTREELKGMRMRQIVPGQDEAGLFDHYARVVETGEPFVVDAFPYADEMQDGQVRLFDMRAEKLGDALCLTFRDVTDRTLESERLSSSEARFRMLAENSSDVVMEHRQTIEWVSSALESTLGWKPADWIGRQLIDFVHLEDAAVLLQRRPEFVDGRPRAGDAMRVLTKDGQYRWMSSRASALRDEHGYIAGGVVGLRDVHEEYLAAERLTRSEALFRAAVTSALVGVALTDGNGSLSVTNAALSRIVQRDVDWLREHNVLDLVHPDDLPVVEEVREQLGSGTQDAFEGTIRLLRADGSVAWTKAAAVRLQGDDEIDVPYLVQVEDVTAEREAQEALAYQAFHDTLTGLRNRAWVLDILHEDLAEARASMRRVGVLFIDLDNFKVINDSLGHTAGDEVIKIIAGRIQDVLGPRDRLGRFGGDEFVVVVPHVRTATDVERVAERIDQVIRQKVVIEGHDIVPSASIGITLSTDESTPDGLLRDTDAALFRAKAAGRGRWHFFDQQMHDEAVDRLTLEAQIRQGIDGRQFVAHYQPLVRLQDRRVVGYEALARWEHPKWGLVPPSDFLPVAEDSGLITPLGQQILEHVCRSLSERPDIPGPISVNVSAVQLSSRDWVGSFLATLDQYQVKPEQIVVEVTETAVLSQMDTTGSELLRLRDMGVGVHVDDFGTGFSSISVLRDLPVSGLKLDRSFVSNLTGEDSQANALAAGVAGLAEGLHLMGVAEGIETEQQWATLLAQGWHYGQGYLFGRPKPLED